MPHLAAPNPPPSVVEMAASLHGGNVNQSNGSTHASVAAAMLATLVTAMMGAAVATIF